MSAVRFSSNIFWRFKVYVKKEWFFFRVTMWSLFYNSFTTYNTVVDTFLEPVFWFVDNFVRYLGPAFVLFVVFLVTAVVVVFYTCLLPHKYADSLFWTVWHLILGHWCLINVVFHYFRAAFTSPGHPPDLVPEVVSICKKCISPKPPRTHHCSICDKCVLKMDHHCPWINNCVGHYNHRYFFLFCVYLWIATIYVTISAYPVYKEHYFGTAEHEVAGFLNPLHILREKFYNRFQAFGNRSEVDMLRPTNDLWFHHFLLMEYLLCSVVTLALGFLVFWHARMISRGETGIEVHINKKEKKKCAEKKQVYRNPYSFGIWKNWQIFLGLQDGRTFWRHVILPSGHTPGSNGLSWPLSTNTDSGLLLL